MNIVNIALVGNPNCGKTAIFNALTGNRERVANYSGVTINKKNGSLLINNKIKCNLIDLPGINNLHPQSLDERITYDIISGNNSNEQVDIFLYILDASNLHTGIRFLLELKRNIVQPIIVILNMIDLAKKYGYEYDLSKLQQLLSLTVIPTVAIKQSGIIQINQAIELLYTQILNNKQHKGHFISSEQSNNKNLKQLYDDNLQAINIINQINIKQGKPPELSETIDNILLHPIYGVLFLLLVLFTVFQLVFNLANYPKDLLQSAVDYLQIFTLTLLPNSLVGSLIGNGIIAGVGAVIVFLPQIIIMYIFIIILEDSGYMARVACLMDRIMASVGLNGKAFIPILSSFACAIPGIMATRVIANPIERLITILVIPLTTCSARIPIYTLLISAFIPNKTLLYMFNLQGVIMFLLFAIGIIFLLLIALIFKFILLSKSHNISIIELPSYKFPTINNLTLELIKPIKSFLTRAGTTILIIMILLWALSTFPQVSSNSLHDANIAPINYSFVGIIGHYCLFLFAPIGFNWQIVASLIPGLAAREVVIAALGTIYALGDNFNQDNLITTLQHSISISTALSLITWYIFAPQCISTLAVVKRETGSYKWVIVMFVYQFLLAYLMAFIVYQTAQKFF